MFGLITISRKQNMKLILSRVYTYLVVKISHTKQLCPETFACWKIRNKDFYQNLQIVIQTFFHTGEHKEPRKAGV